MAKKNPAGLRIKPSKVLIDLELGKCLTVNTKKAHEILQFVAHSCNLVRNKVARRWETWRRDNPDWQPEQLTNRQGELKFANTTKTIPVMEHPAISQSEYNALYHEAVGVAPHLHTNLISKCRNEALIPIKAKAPWIAGGYRYERILSYEDRLPSFHSQIIPVQNADAVFCYDGAMWAGDKVSSGNKAAAKKHSASCVFGVKLLRYPKTGSNFEWPEQLPRKKQLEFLLFRVKVEGLSAGIKKRLKEIAAFVTPPRDSAERGDKSRKFMKFCDSKLIYDDGSWRLQLLTTAPPSKPLDAGRVAILVPRPFGSAYPFTLHLPGDRTRMVGNQRGCTSCYRDKSIQLEHLRRLIGDRNRKGIGKGHGRAHILEDASRLARKSKKYQAHFLKNVVIDAVREAKRDGCGLVIYREPNIWLRQRMWNKVLVEVVDKNTKRHILAGLVLNTKGNQIHFPYNLPKNLDLCFDWTKFDGYLKYKMEQAGILVYSSRIGYGEYEEYLSTGNITDGEEEKGVKKKNTPKNSSKNNKSSGVAKKRSTSGPSHKASARSSSLKGANKTPKREPLAKSKMRRRGIKNGSGKPNNACSAAK